MYDKMSTITLHGSVLDLGGALNADYHLILGGNPTYTVANIEKDHYGYDIYLDIEKKFTIESDSYDNVILINVLEHIFNHKNVLHESYRVMKTGGTIVSATPFVFKQHGCPHDFFRYTGDCLQKLFAEAGFNNIEVTPVGVGIMPVCYQCISGCLPFSILRSIALQSSLSLEKLLRKLSKRYSNASNDFILGFVVTAQKSTSTQD